MIYILSGLTGLLILVALFTFIHKRRHSEDPETIVAPPADCCGAHAICEKGLKKASPQIDYFDDEELDVGFRGTAVDKLLRKPIPTNRSKYSGIFFTPFVRKK